MQASIIEQIENYINSSITQYHSSNNSLKPNIFDLFIQKCQLYYDKPAHSIGEIKLKLNKKLKGDIFEHFALKYCQVVLGFDSVWLLADVPFEILNRLKLRRQDLGIDLVAHDAAGKFYAIQAKYRKWTNRRENSALSWKQLSTFHALTSRTGPFVKHIVITNAHYCRQFGRKTKKDKSICYGSLKGIKLEQWLAMAGLKGHQLITNNSAKLKLTFKKPKIKLKKPLRNPDRPPLNELREKRLAFLNKITNNV